MKRFWSLTWREAQVKTYSDALLGITVCLVIAIAMVPPMRKVAPHKTPTSHAHRAMWSQRWRAQR